MREKIIYSIGETNRLIIRRKGKTLTPDGRFKIDEGNRLCFWLNEPLAYKKEYQLPQKINLDGKWRLNEEHNLEIVSDKYSAGSLVLKINIISASPEGFIFGIAQVDRIGQEHLRILKLSGFWKADTYNRLNFVIEKKASPDALIFKAEWQINKQQQIVYAYERAVLKTKIREKSILVFKGSWQVSSFSRLVYLFEHNTKSRFEFRVQLESANIYPKEGAIRYRIGIGVKKERLEKVICLFGEWKFSRSLGLIFQMDYGKNGVAELNFGAVMRLSKENEIIFKLTDETGKPVGISVTFTHKFLKKLDAEVLLKIKRLEKESGITAGIRVPF